jgi:hypothetical protein
LFETLSDTEKTYNIKELSETLQEKFPDTSINQLNTILNYFAIKRLVKKNPERNKYHIILKPYFSIGEIQTKSRNRRQIAEFILDHLYSKTGDGTNQERQENTINFSVLELK